MEESDEEGGECRLTMSNDRHVSDICRLVHERTDLGEMSVVLLTNGSVEPKDCIYLFHGKAATTIVLAMIADMQMAKERNLVKILRVKAVAEALH